MSELDWMQRSFLVIGSFLSGMICISMALLGSVSIQGVEISLPFTMYGITIDRIVVACAGAICLGVQTHCYKIQKALIETLVKGIEG